MNDKELRIKTGGIQTDNHHSYYHHKYEPTAYEILDQLFDELPLTTNDSFVDFGCGKGRINFYVHHRFHCQSVGVELNDEYYQIALDNKSSYQDTHKEQIQFHHILAQSYLPSEKDNYFYFFNPFSVEIFGHVINNIYDSIADNPRDCTLILYYPDSDYIYYLENQTCLTFVQTIPVSGYSKDSRECFCIYKF